MSMNSGFKCVFSRQRDRFALIINQTSFFKNWNRK